MRDKTVTRCIDFTKEDIQRLNKLALERNEILEDYLAEMIPKYLIPLLESEILSHQSDELTPDELTRRKSFIKDTRKEVANIRDEATDPRSRGQVQSRQKSNLLGKSKYQRMRDDEIRSNDDFIANQAQRQEMIMRDQDDQVEDLGKAVGNIREMGLTISDELDEQAE